MKRINYIIGLSLLSLSTLTGCDSILDKDPLDKFTNNNFWTNASNVEGYANTFYNEFTGYGNGGGAGLFYFKTLSDQEITCYVDTYKPFDKAGAYGIQEWIGYIGIERIEGSFYNVMGLPVQQLYEALRRFPKKS